MIKLIQERYESNASYAIRILEEKNKILREALKEINESCRNYDTVENAPEIALKALEKENELQEFKGKL